MEPIELHDIIILDNKEMGTVVHIYNEGGYEVETLSGKTETVTENRISKV